MDRNHTSQAHLPNTCPHSHLTTPQAHAKVLPQLNVDQAQVETRKVLDDTYLIHKTIGQGRFAK